MQKHDIIAIARDEVLHPTWLLTAQYLQVHALVLGNEGPVIAGVEYAGTDDEQVALIYFALVDEPYFLTLRINLYDSTLTLVTIQPALEAYLSVASQDVTPEEVATRLDLVPTYTHHKGAKRPRINHVFQEHLWIFEVLPDTPASLEHKVAHLLATLEPKQGTIQNLLVTCDCCIQIMYYGYKDELWGWQLTPEQLKQFAMLGITVDLALRASGPDLLP